MKLTKEDFIKKAKIVHTGENLDYSKVVYNGLYKKVCIIDHDINPKTGNEYGEYWQTPRNHLKGQKHPLKSGRVKISQDEFIERAKKVHKDENLDYSLVHYVNMHKKVKIIDNDINPETGKEYGIFEIEANSFLKGHTNAEKAFDKRGKKKRIGLDEFIRKSKEVHKGENLDYSKFIYKSMREKGIIIDHDINPRTGKEYGEYLCSPSNHLKGKGHPVKGLIKQGINNRISQEEFIRRSKEAHPGENLDYSKAHYITGTIPVCIIDHDINPRTGKEYGEYWQRPSDHMNGRGNIAKSMNKVFLQRRKTKKQFIIEANKAHPNENLDYGEFDYINANAKGKIIDHDINPSTGKEYGEYWQTPYAHIKGCSHPKKRESKIADTLRKTQEKAIIEMKEAHPDSKFDFSKVKYIDVNTEVEIICHKIDHRGNIHGSFFVTPQNFKRSKFGCPKCAYAGVSKEEFSLQDFVKRYFKPDDVIFNSKKILSYQKQIDIFIKSLNIGIEFDGLYWHCDKNYAKTDNYHLLKTKECRNLGIRLIHIFEDEWYNHMNIVKDKLSYIFHKRKDKKKIGARKCKVMEIYKSIKGYSEKEVKRKSKQISDEFLEMNHIQGKANATFYYGAYYDNRIIAVMLFKKTAKEGEYELNRFASDSNIIIQGIASKIIHHFIKEHSPKAIISFADRRWVNQDNNLYTKIGFKETCIIPPAYWYFKPALGIKRFHRFNFRKDILLRKYPDYGLTQEMTEKEMAEKLGFYRIYDCGLIKYTLHTLP